MSTESADPGHGHSPAAWTAVTIMLIAFVIGTVAFFFEAAVIVWVAVAICLIGLIVGWVMARLGYGVNGPKYVPKGH